MKIVGVSLALLIIFIFLATSCLSEPLTTIKSSEAADYLWKWVRMEITPIERLEDEYRSHPFYVFINYNYYRVYKTQEGILVLVEKPNELSLGKTVGVTGRIERYYKRPGNYELVISLSDFKKISEDRH